MVETIEKHQANLDELSRYAVRLEITNNGGKIYTIGCDSDSEHEYAKPAQMLIKAIKEDLQHRIDNLKSHLELL